MTAGWALSLFTESAARGLHDVEIALPAGRFDEAMDALPGFEWDVVGGGRVWPFPEQCAQHFQTWLREPGTGIYRLDVFREPSIASRWACGHDLTIRLPNDELILHSDDGIPYVISEVALLFKAEHVPPKDQHDFRTVVPALGPARKDRLRSWLSTIHPGHLWICALDNLR